MFTQNFDTYVVPDDKIYCTVDGISYTATLIHDPDTRAVDEEYYDTEAIKAWRNDEWFFVGVSVTAKCCDVELVGKYACTVWGCEANLNDSNLYLRDIANELLHDAQDLVSKKLIELAPHIARVALMA